MQQRQHGRFYETLQKFGGCFFDERGWGGLKLLQAKHLIKILTHGCGGEGEGDLLDSAVDCCLLGVEAPDLAFLLQRAALKSSFRIFFSS